MTLNEIRMAAAIAWRDMRGGAKGARGGLRLMAAGVLVGVAAVALVGALSENLRDGARQGALQAVGGDLSLRLFHVPPSEEQLALIRQVAGEGSRVNVSAELRPMVTNAKGGAPVLVELKGVEISYPLYGEAKVSPNAKLYDSLNLENGMYGAVVDPAGMDVLGLVMGSTIEVGDARYQVRGVLLDEPDRAFRAFSLGPRVMVLRESLLLTGLSEPGAEVYYYTRAKLAPGQDAAAALAQIDQAFPDAGWRMVNARDGVPGVERVLAMAHVLLLFIGLGVMLVGGAGISGAARAHILAKMDVIAILKSIGTPPAVVQMALGLQVAGAASLGAVLGAGLGAFGPGLAAGALSDQVPFAISASPALKPLVGAALFGVLTALLFAWWPLMSLHSVTARVLLRERFARVPGRLSVGGIAGAVAIAAGIVALIFWISPMAVLTLIFLIGASVLALFYLSLGRGFTRLAKVLAKGRRRTLRMALGNLHRPGAPTGAVVIALGLTLTVLVALDAMGRAGEAHVSDALPKRAADLVSFSLEREQMLSFYRGVAQAELAETITVAPFLHARVQAINGVAVGEFNIPRSLSWVVRGDRGVSFAAGPPPRSELVAGEWWLDFEAPGLSLDSAVASKLGLKLGDTITLNVSGHVVTAPIKNLRKIDWTGLDLDFPIVTTPGTMRGVPFTYAATLKAKEGRAAELESFIRTKHPDVPLIRVADVLSALGTALDAVVSGLKLAALMTGVAALVVLAGSVFQGLRERMDEALLFKVLGARRGQLLAQVVVEFVSLGALVALASVPIGLGVAFGVARAAGLSSVGLDVTGALTVALAGILVTAGVGLVATFSAYAAAPSEYLRSREV